MHHSSLDKVSGLVTQCRIGLALRQPFLATAIMRLPVRAAIDQSWCKTMCTDGYRIFFNPQWVETLSKAEIRGVLAHELLHVIFRHQSRGKDRNHLIWNFAADHAINLLLLECGFEIPKGGLADRSFIGMTCEAIYDELIKDADSAEPSQNTGTPQIGIESDSDGIIVPVGADLISPEDPRTKGLREESDGDQESQQQIVEEIRQDAIGKLQGNIASWAKSELEASSVSKINWRELLSGWLIDRVKTDWSIWPPSKKFISHGLFLPSVGIEAPGHIVVAVDTSGSMSDSALSDIFAEIREFRESFPTRLTVLQADAEVSSVEEYGVMDGTELPTIQKIKGRGGTSFIPVFNWISEHFRDETIALIYATDGYGNFPKILPWHPCVWIVTSDGLKNEGFPFGSVFRLGE